MNGFHRFWRDMSAHESASTTGKNSANWTVGNSTRAGEGRSLLRFQEEPPRQLHQVALEIRGGEFQRVGVEPAAQLLEADRARARATSGGSSPWWIATVASRSGRVCAYGNWSI